MSEKNCNSCRFFDPHCLGRLSKQGRCLAFKGQVSQGSLCERYSEVPEKNEDLKIPGMTWVYLINECLESLGLTLEDVISCTLTTEEMIEEFGIKGKYYPSAMSFTLWTDEYVLFPAGDDHKLWCAFAPRNPSEEEVEIVGGGFY